MHKTSDQLFDELREEMRNRKWYHNLWWSLQRTWRDLKDWFRYRFIPKHRYHTLNLHEPGYSEPRSQMVYAVMGIVERYVDELRVNWHSGDLSYMSDRDVVWKYFKWMKREREDNEEDYIPGWLEHYQELYDILDWWHSVKDHPDFDMWNKETLRMVENYDNLEIENYLEDPVFRSQTNSDKVTEMLKRAVSLRQGMWT